jgi:hypothetical protein
MSFFQKTQPIALFQWLEIATKRLWAPARERIRVEIEAHYAQSIQGLMAGGMPKCDAHFAALIELGDPETAGKNFRKKHLTKFEADLMDALIKESRWIMFLLFPIACFVFTACCFADFISPVIICAESIPLVIFPIATFLLSRRLDSKWKLRLLLTMQAMSGVWAAVLINNTNGLMINTHRLTGHLRNLEIIVFTGMLFVLLARLYPLIKFRKIADAADLATLVKKQQKT